MDADGNKYGPYDLTANPDAEPFNEAAWYWVNRRSGVHSGGTITFDGRTVQVAPLIIEVHGSFLAREEPWTDTSPATSGSAPRRDLLVARRRLTGGNEGGATPGKTFLTVLRGTPASNPVNPTPDWANDEMLFSWEVPGSGGTTLTAVTDHRRFLASNGEAGGQGTLARGREPTSGAQVTPGGVATRFVGATNLGGVLLVPGREYEVLFDPYLSLQTAVGLARIESRMARGATPGPSQGGNVVVAATQVQPPNLGAAGRMSAGASGRFQVSSTGSYHLSLFGTMVTGQTATMVLDPNGTGGYEHVVRDVGPADPSVRLVTL